MTSAERAAMEPHSAREVRGSTLQGVLCGRQKVGKRCHINHHLLLTERSTPAARQFTVQVPIPGDEAHVRHLEIFLVNGPPDAGPLRAFKNHCPHAGGPLNLFPDIFFRDGYLLCTRHAARFRWDDGVCVSPPCPGERLTPLDVEECSHDGIFVTAKTLAELCEEGEGGSTLKTLSEAAGDGGLQVVPPRVRVQPYKPRRRRSPARTGGNEPAP